jgi:hypothetical protein
MYGSTKNGSQTARVIAFPEAAGIHRHAEAIPGETVTGNITAEIIPRLGFPVAGGIQEDAKDKRKKSLNILQANARLI